MTCPVRLDRFELVDLPRDAAAGDPEVERKIVRSMTRPKTSPHFRRNNAPPDVSLRVGYRCGKCGADWQWQDARLRGKLLEKLTAGERVLYATEV